eukprot:CAMPEP_0178659026 /NCGR_PEP_ID=MMETSP0698-20121128/26317_1 /TAXON_ID=265572 /ORGANISM="Extubocellulus spinifer, Strain CCMP396" /LENGTH=60 /DNA_ID=CAMNT_0020301479 /DNA_START=16 /DNA_END=198 /DNA_ORIENTATION=+
MDRIDATKGSATTSGTDIGGTDDDGTDAEDKDGNCTVVDEHGCDGVRVWEIIGDETRRKL